MGLYQYLRARACANPVYCLAFFLLASIYVFWYDAAMMYNAHQGVTKFHDRYPAYGEMCLSLWGPRHNGRLAPKAVLNRLRFNESEPITLLADCIRVNGKFSPFHWSLAVWNMHALVMNDSLTVREIVIPCTPEDLNLQDIDKNTWIQTYYPAFVKDVERKEIPMRFIGSKPICLRNVAFLRKSAYDFAAKPEMDNIRRVAYDKCGLTPSVPSASDSVRSALAVPTHLGSPGLRQDAPQDENANSVAILVRPNSRTFPQSDLNKFTRLANARGLNVSILSVPLDYCEQVKLFAQPKYKYLLTPHGAQMTNALFLPKGVTVFEFFPPSFSIDMYCLIKYSTPIEWIKVHRGGKVLDNSCDPTRERHSWCQSQRICRMLIKLLPVRMYGLDDVLGYIDSARSGTTGNSLA